VVGAERGLTTDQGTYRATDRTRTGREDDLDDGAVEELLFGWFEGWNRWGEKATDPSLSFIPSFPLFGILTNYLLSRDIINPITMIR
jgi:hypothetical protein